MGAAALLLILPLLPPLPGTHPIAGATADSMGTALALSILSSDQEGSGITSPGQGMALPKGLRNYWGAGRDRKKRNRSKIWGEEQAQHMDFSS